MIIDSGHLSGQFSVTLSRISNQSSDKFISWHLVYCRLQLQVLLLLIRVMDDVKDYDKDKIVHPLRCEIVPPTFTCWSLSPHPIRPLPRGLIRVSEVIQVIHGTLLAMLLYAAILALRFNPAVGFLFTVQVSPTLHPPHKAQYPQNVYLGCLHISNVHWVWMWRNSGADTHSLWVDSPGMYCYIVTSWM